MRNKVVLEIIRSAEIENRNFLYEVEGKEILNLLGIENEKPILSTSEEEVISVAKNLGYPVVLKIVSPNILHKSDVGGVALNLRNELEVREAYRAILKNVNTKAPRAKIKGVSVSKMAPPSIEVIIGAIRDPQFGATIMFGIGGVMVEIIRDTSFRVAPLVEEEAESMIKEIRTYKILEGTRGFPKVDVSAIVELLMCVSKIMIDYPEIGEIDLNPVIVYEKGCKTVDARFILSSAEAKHDTSILSPSDFDSILGPQSVAVVGASANTEKIGYKILKNIIDASFRGRIYPINLKADEVLGLKAYPRIIEVPDNIDVAVIVVPAATVITVIEDCVKKGVKGAVIISSGFKDVGIEGAALERKILEIARGANLRIIGPNCQGVSNPNEGFCATWPLVRNVGNVAIISQSGTIALEIPSFLARNELGYSKAVALGNKSDVDEADLISWLADDKNTKAIAVYSEGMPEGRKLMEAIRKASMRKAVIFLKGGRTEAGKRAVLAHTGSLAGRAEVFTAAVKQSGGISVKNLEELCAASKTFSTLPLPKGNKILIVTSSGGSGILASDACEDAGLTLATLPPSTVEKLRKRLPEWCIVGNPLDLTGNALSFPNLYADVLEEIYSDESVDMVLLIYGDPIQDSFKAVRSNIEKAKLAELAVVVCYLGGAEVQAKESKHFQRHGVPVFEDPSQAIVALGYLNQYKKNVLRIRSEKKQK